MSLIVEPASSSLEESSPQLVKPQACNSPDSDYAHSPSKEGDLPQLLLSAGQQRGSPTIQELPVVPTSHLVFDCTQLSSSPPVRLTLRKGEGPDSSTAEQQILPEDEDIMLDPESPPSPVGLAGLRTMRKKSHARATERIIDEEVDGSEFCSSSADSVKAIAAAHPVSVRSALDLVNMISEANADSEMPQVDVTDSEPPASPVGLAGLRAMRASDSVHESPTLFELEAVPLEVEANQNAPGLEDGSYSIPGLESSASQSDGTAESCVSDSNKCCARSTDLADGRYSIPGMPSNCRAFPTTADLPEASDNISEHSTAALLDSPDEGYGIPPPTPDKCKKVAKVAAPCSPVGLPEVKQFKVSKALSPKPSELEGWTNNMLLTADQLGMQAEDEINGTTAEEAVWMSSHKSCLRPKCRRGPNRGPMNEQFPDAYPDLHSHDLDCKRDFVSSSNEEFRNLSSQRQPMLNGDRDLFDAEMLLERSAESLVLPQGTSGTRPRSSSTPTSCPIALPGLSGVRNKGAPKEVNGKVVEGKQKKIAKMPRSAVVLKPVLEIHETLDALETSSRQYADAAAMHSLTSPAGVSTAQTIRWEAQQEVVQQPTRASHLLPPSSSLSPGYKSPKSPLGGMTMPSIGTEICSWSTHATLPNLGAVDGVDTAVWKAEKAVYTVQVMRANRGDRDEQAATPLAPVPEISPILETDSSLKELEGSPIAVEYQPE